MCLIHTWVWLGRQVGGATGEIGDPSGRTTERPQLDADQLATNVAAIERQLATVAGHAETLWHRQQPHAPRPAAGWTPMAVLNNRPVYANLSILDFLQQVGRNARVSSMLAKER